MTSAFVRARRVAPISSVAVGAALLVSGLGSPALAASCPSGSTLVTGNVCEVVFASTPSAVWTPPAGVTIIDALLVGAGGFGQYQYGAGGGDVQVYELAVTGDVTVTVGLGGTGTYDPTEDSVVAQGSNTFYASGGDTPENSVIPIGGTSGSGLEAIGAGGSGAGAASTDESGGAGLIVGEIPTSDGTLFADDTTCFGGGGAGQIGGTLGTATCGGGYTTDSTSLTGVAPEANSGGGGGTWWTGSQHATQVGADGKVVIRFDVPELPATGQSDFTGAMTAGFGAVLIGAGAVAFGIRRRKA